MFQRIFRVLSSLGLSTFVLFMLAITSSPASAHTLFLSRPNTFAHAVATRSPSVAPHLISTDVICRPTLVYNPAHPWVQTGNGPASFGCGGYAVQVTTPTNDSASWDVGGVQSNLGAKYSLRAFITEPANAVMDYQIFVGGLRSKCTVDQSQALVGWNSVCSFSVSSNDRGLPVTILESSGQASPRILSASAIQLLVICQIC
jgi:hypothetical protein